LWRNRTHRPKLVRQCWSDADSDILDGAVLQAPNLPATASLIGDTMR
jgi:hypothetical protein